MTQADGQTKPRPVLFLATMRPFGDFLVCGISSQLHQEVQGFDELMMPGDSDFLTSGLRCPSLVRLGFLGVYAKPSFRGVMGSISKDRHRLLLSRLGTYFTDLASRIP
jgi:mRNA interferase MazF